MKFWGFILFEPWSMCGNPFFSLCRCCCCCCCFCCCCCCCCCFCCCCCNACCWPFVLLLEESLIIDHLHNYGPGMRFGASPSGTDCDVCVSHFSFRFSSAVDFFGGTQHPLFSSTLSDEYCSNLSFENPMQTWRIALRTVTETHRRCTRAVCMRGDDLIYHTYHSRNSAFLQFRLWPLFFSSTFSDEQCSNLSLDDPNPMNCTQNSPKRRQEKQLSARRKHRNHMQVTDRPSPDAPSLTQTIIVQMVYFSCPMHGSRYYRKRGSASYIVREVRSVRERERERERESCFTVISDYCFSANRRPVLWSRAAL